jgi:hypothetical protein
VNTAPGVIFTTLHFLVTLERIQEVRVFFPGKPFQPSILQNSNLLGPFLIYEEKEYGEYGPWYIIFRLVVMCLAHRHHIKK